MQNHDTQQEQYGPCGEPVKPYRGPETPNRSDTTPTTFGNTSLRWLTMFAVSTLCVIMLATFLLLLASGTTSTEASILSVSITANTAGILYVAVIVADGIWGN